MAKIISYAQYGITLFYILFNYTKISAAFRSDIWSKEIDLINHVTNFNIQLQIIGIVLFSAALVCLVGHLKGIKLSKYLLGIILLLSIVLFANSIFDFKRWIEINVFGGGTLLVFTLIVLLTLLWKMYKGNKVVSEA